MALAINESFNNKFVQRFIQSMDGGVQQYM